jgi:hypothetical protein
MGFLCKCVYTEMAVSAGNSISRIWKLEVNLKTNIQIFNFRTTAMTSNPC